MALSRLQIERVSVLILKKLKEEGRSELLSEPKILKDKIAAILLKNFDEERTLNEDAEKLLNQHRKEFGMGLDEDKALSMIRRQLAKERKFVL